MYVVRHEAIRDDFNSVLLCIARVVAEVCLVVTLAEKDALAMIAALRDVMGHTWKHDAGMSWHDANVSAAIAGR